MDSLLNLSKLFIQLLPHLLFPLVLIRVLTLLVLTVNQGDIAA